MGNPPTVPCPKIPLGTRGGRSLNAQTPAVPWSAKVMSRSHNTFFELRLTKPARLVTFSVLKSLKQGPVGGLPVFRRNIELPSLGGDTTQKCAQIPAPRAENATAGLIWCAPSPPARHCEHQFESTTSCTCPDHLNLPRAPIISHGYESIWGSNTLPNWFNSRDGRPPHHLPTDFLDP